MHVVSAQVAVSPLLVEYGPSVVPHYQVSGPSAVLNVYLGVGKHLSDDVDGSLKFRYSGNGGGVGDVDVDGKRGWLEFEVVVEGRLRGVSGFGTH